MKFRITLILISLVLSSQLYSQNITVIGLKGGANISTLGPTGAGYTAKVGYNLGVYSASRFFQELGVQMEILMSEQGARSEYFSDLKLNYTYLAVPLFANIYFIESAAIEGGLQMGYLLNATQVDAGDKYNISNDVKNFDFSGIIGINYSKPYGSVGLRYVLGINNTTDASRSAEIRYTNKVLQLYIAKTLYSSE